MLSGPLFRRQRSLSIHDGNTQVLMSYTCDMSDVSQSQSLRQSKCCKTHVFTHFSFWRRVWEYIIFTVSCSCVAELSFIAIFAPDITLLQYSPFLILDVIYIVDLYVVTHTSFISHGIVIEEKKRMRAQYGKLALVCHLIGAIPLGWICACFTTKYWVHIIFSANRLLRLKRAIDANEVIRHSLVYLSWFSRLFPLLIMQYNIIHFFACIFYLSAFFEDEYDSWISLLHWNELNPPRQYIVSVYFVMTTVFTIGTGDITPQTSAERIIVIFIQLIGCMTNAYLVGTMVSLLIDPMRTKFTSDFREMWDYMKFKGLPDTLRYRILHEFQDKLDRCNGSEEPRSVFKYVPETIKDHLKLDMVRKCLASMSVMKNASEYMYVAFANVMQPISFSPGDVLVAQDSVTPVLFLLRTGIVQLLVNDMVVSTHDCENGVAFGELELFADLPRPATLKALTRIDGWTVDRNTMTEATHQVRARREMLYRYKEAFPDNYRQIRRSMYNRDHAN